MAEEQTTGKVAMIWVPDELAGEVKNYASSLIEEQTPDVSGYAAFVKGIGDARPTPGGIGGKVASIGAINALSGTGCAITLAKNDFMCDDED